MRTWHDTDKQYYIDTIRANEETTLAAGRLGFDPPVIGCPDWDVGDLIAHVGSANTFWSKWIRERPAGPGPETGKQLREERNRLLPGYEQWVDSGFDPSLRPAGVIEFAAQTGQTLTELLQDLDPSETVWTFYEPDQTGSFWFRRIAIETTVHLLDVERAHGIERTVDPELAANALDEYLNIILRLQPPGSVAPKQRGESFLFTPTDGRPPLRVAFPGTDVVVTEDAAAGDVEVRGSSKDLLLFVWGRAGAERVDIRGDIALAGRWGEFAGRF